MPNIKSAIKRVKTSEASKAQNITVKSSMRTAVKKAEAAIVNNDTEAKVSFAEAASKLDKAAAKGLIHKNAASRKKARLMKKLNANG
ncbi:MULTISPECIES: 30S ribosomal protein S20 [Bacillaceae]|jgi:small subunit ribosomal protein S20|uniref:Small ribosomal subunit protein bS20 n=3 Tax=Mesobacillus TaxID=2675231 RepID=W4RT29_9BACI|nr:MULTISPECIES: 30S ribosomal protein S20 [Bacillaceae]MBS8264973.1 30S ribosomal protein S20 [Mesobacillus boroniphilus]MBT2694994.1 30S ribosomal protein S20 [Bacillus sp. ISL-55]WLR56279.1 30S ribosomal protein S20 [Mesobacillus subterraneus]GAE47018.1 SSU ribosomal protein S20p [Mesobacillus boroniphilus JCM 21738]GAM13454.1 SSU ribosomal protein S20p [Mesobacillus selenatarsenatis SF-1]